MNINLHIERLVLDGLSIERRDGALVQAALEAELSRLLATEGLAQHLMSGGAMPALRADAIQVAGDRNPSHLGTQIARAVYGGLSK